MKTSLLDAGHQPRQGSRRPSALATRAAPARAAAIDLAAASRCAAWMWAMSPTLQAPLTMTKSVVAAVDEHQVVDDRAFVGQQQAVALLAGRQPDDVDRHQRFEGRRRIRPGQPQLAHVRDVEQAGRSRACGGARPSGRRDTGPAWNSRRRAPCGRPAPHAGHAGGSSEALVLCDADTRHSPKSGADKPWYTPWAAPAVRFT